jgi:hypothetical protein
VGPLKEKERLYKASPFCFYDSENFFFDFYLKRKGNKNAPQVCYLSRKHERLIISEFITTIFTKSFCKDNMFFENSNVFC